MAWIYTQPGSKNWFIGYRMNGRLVRTTLKTDDKQIAKRQLEKFRAKRSCMKCSVRICSRLTRSGRRKL